MRPKLPIVTRRALLAGAVLTTAGAALGGATPALAEKPKRSHADVAYRDFPNGNERCELCAPFLPPDQCRTVVGPVSRQGWCKIYTGA